MKNIYFNAEDLAVGYNKHVLIDNINIEIEKGKILTLIGPNGAGKSTILKTITKQLAKIDGSIYIDKNEISNLLPKDMAKQVSVVLTDKIKAEMMTVFDVVSLGRYPYTNAIGKLTKDDHTIIEQSLKTVDISHLANNYFSHLSDGQKQRVILARAICQMPQLIILDEPCNFLDIKHKTELVEILRKMAREEEITIIMSMHEIDLATKISDYLMLVKENNIKFLLPNELSNTIIEELYDLKKGTYNLSFGSLELSKPKGEPKVFIVGGAGFGASVYRKMQKKNIPFATGILFENDIDFEIAKDLSNHVISCPAFEPMSEEHLLKAKELMLKCEKVIDAGTPNGSLNKYNFKLLELAKENNIPIER